MSAQYTLEGKIQRIANAGVLRYLLGGGVTVATEYSAFICLYALLGVKLFISNSASFCIGLFVSFLVNRFWAFKSLSYAKKTHHQVMLYVILAATNLFLSNILIGVLTFVGLGPLLAKIISIALIAGWNFIVYKKFIFADTTTNRA